MNEEASNGPTGAVDADSDDGANDGSPKPLGGVRTAVKRADVVREELKGVLPADYLAAWTDEDILAYKDVGITVPKTKDGFWVRDRRRGVNPRKWPSLELRAALRGELVYPRQVSEEDIYEALIIKYGLPGNWEYADVITFLDTGEKPAYTEAGVLIRDRSRALKRLDHWTCKELKAALVGQIESKYDKEALLKVLKPRLGLSETYASGFLLKNLDVTTESTMNNTLLASKLEEYKQARTKPGARLTEKSQGEAQGILYDAIRRTMKRESHEFKEGWCLILDFVHANNAKLFDGAKAFVGWAQIPMKGTQAQTFEDLLTLICATANPAERKSGAAKYQLKTILQYVVNEQERNNIIAFYGA